MKKRRKRPPGVRIFGASYWLDFTYGGVRVRRRVGPVGSITEEDVEKVRAVAIADAVKNGEGIDPRSRRAVLLGMLKSRYLDALPQGRRRTRFEQYAAHLIRVFGAGTPVDRIGLSDLVSYRAQREAEKVQSSGREHLTSPAEVTREVSALRAMLSWAERSDVPLGKGNIFRRLSRADRKSVFPPELLKAPAVLSNQDVEAICSHLTAPYQRFVRFLYATGVRYGEALALSWPEVFARDTIVPHALLARTKAGKPRVVPLSRDAVAILAGCPRTCDRVFTGAGGRSIQNVPRAWSVARVKAALPAARLHDLRHSFASHFIERGGDVAALRDVCGWADLKMPSRYVHASPARALAVLNGSNQVHSGQTVGKAVSDATA